MRVATPIALLAAAATTSTAAATVVVPRNTTQCADGLYLIVARGTGEDPGPGAMGLVADRIAERIQGSAVVGLDYPAALSDPSYVDSVQDGVSALNGAVATYHAACPDSKLAVFGYSQGAQVATDVFCGGTVDGFGTTKPLSMDLVESSVIAIILFGDPSHIANTTYDKGTSIMDGIFDREDISVCEDLSDRLVSYCDSGDTYCDRGDDREVHGTYVELYGDEVVDYVVGQFENETAAPNSTTATAAATATATSATMAPTSSGAPTESSSPTETGDAEGAAAATAGVGPGLGLWFAVSLAVGLWEVL